MICPLCEEQGQRHHVYNAICKSCAHMLGLARTVSLAQAGDDSAKADLRRRCETVNSAALWCRSWMRTYPIMLNGGAMADPTSARPEPKHLRDGRRRYSPSRDRQARA